MNYYPSQGSGYGQPVVYTTSSHQGGHHGHHRHYPSNDDYYDQPVTYVPTHSSSRRHGRHYSAPAVTIAPTAPVVVQPSYSGHSHHGHHHRKHHGGSYYPRSFGERVRHFFGLAPTANYRYKSDRSSWGFMGYSRRPRYTDARTGGEVDRHGRPVYRV